jgi:hypothetical protein
MTGVWRWGVRTGRDAMVRPGADGKWLEDVAGTRMVFYQQLAKEKWDLVVSEDPPARNPRLAGSSGSFSPSGTLVATEKVYATHVYDAASSRFPGRPSTGTVTRTSSSTSGSMTIRSSRWATRAVATVRSTS